MTTNHLRGAAARSAAAATAKALDAAHSDVDRATAALNHALAEGQDTAPPRATLTPALRRAGVSAALGTRDRLTAELEGRQAQIDLCRLERIRSAAAALVATATAARIDLLAELTFTLETAP